MSIKISYFVHDLDDPAVARRARMFTLGGAEVKLVGFHRSPMPILSVNGMPAIDLGKSEPGKFASRAISVAKAGFRLNGMASAVEGADVFIARNLEMLVLAVQARRRFGHDIPVVYECLDIHRLLLSRGAAGRLLRLAENLLWRKTDLLLTSSPAFLSNYFAPRRFPAGHRLVENKVFNPAGGAIARPSMRPAPAAPWRIGWFGVLRCRRSFEILSALTRALPGVVEVVLRGRPAPAIFPDFEAEVARTPGFRFGGAYHNPGDLESIYSDVHFAWAVDYYEASQNSAWLLPNRIYEGSLWGAVPLALAGVETGRWLANKAAGVLLPDSPEAKLKAFFATLESGQYNRLSGAVLRIPRNELEDGAQSCCDLVRSLPLRRKVTVLPRISVNPIVSGSLE